jgi:hypothetical protein
MAGKNHITINKQPAEDTDTWLLYLKNWKFVATNPKKQIYEWPI